MSARIAQPLTGGFLLCWPKNINCINFTQQRFGLKNHIMSAQLKALSVCKLSTERYYDKLQLTI